MKMQELSLSNKIKLILTEELLNHIDFGHKKIGNLEWSGFLLYKQEAGTFEDISSIVLKAYNFFPLDVGTSGHTEFNMTPEALDEMMDIYPDFTDYKLGLIHTHHNMATFFSGEDMKELHDNTANYPYYLSLIVNNAGTYSAKVAFIAKEKESFLETNSFIGGVKIPLSRGEDDLLVLVDCDIEKERVEYSPGEALLTKWNALKAKPMYTNTYNDWKGRHFNYGTQANIGFKGKGWDDTNNFRESIKNSTKENDEKNQNSTTKNKEKFYWKEKKGMMLPVVSTKDIERLICKIVELDPNCKESDYLHKLRVKNSNLLDSVSRDQFYTAVLDIYEDCIEEEISWYGSSNLTVDEICYVSTKIVMELESPIVVNLDVSKDLINLICSYCNEIFEEERLKNITIKNKEFFNNIDHDDQFKMYH